MTKYLFQTHEFGVSDVGIHLLRSGFNYQTIKWAEINSIKIEKGKELHNWAIVFLIGMVLLVGGVYLSLIIIDTLMHNEIGKIYKMMLMLLIPCIGVYFVYNSLLTGTILRINYSTNKYDMFPLKEIVKAKKLDNFKSLIREKLSNKVAMVA